MFPPDQAPVSGAFVFLALVWCHNLVLPMSSRPATSSEPPLLALARIYLSQGQADMALRSLRTLSPNEVHDADLLHQWGLMEMQTGETARAADLLRRAWAMAPTVDAGLANNLGYVLQLAGHGDEAVEIYRVGVAHAPADAALGTNLGLCLKQAGHLAEALAAFDALLARHPHSVEGLCNRANVLVAMGRLEDALQSNQMAFALAPQHLTVLCNLSSVLSQLMRAEEALALAEQALAVAPRHATAWVQKGLALQNLRRFDEAAASYRQALQINPELGSAQQSLAGLYVAGLADEDETMVASSRSLALEVQRQFPAGGSRSEWHMAPFRLKHDFQQAQYLAGQGAPIPGLDRFLERAGAVLARASLGEEPVRLLADDWAAMSMYQQTPWVVASPTLPHALNPANDWRAIEQAYLRGSPEMLYIDDFLAPDALSALRRYCLESKVWLTEYRGKYLGAFANQGFLSPLHVQIGREMRERMPLVFRDNPVNQLWGFKYDAKLGTGIGVHADFAAVNLNFWITPDEYNLAPEAGGLKVYHVPAPQDWNFYQYNNDVSRIYSFLKEHRSDCLTVPYRCNRAVLFNSALFHETDRIDFVDSYEARRINMTYLFGRQLW